MGKSWLMCVLLGALAWGQAAPGAPAPQQQQPAPAPADTSATVPPDAAVITVIGVCPATPRAAATKGTAGTSGKTSGAAPAATAKNSAAKSSPADCETVITKAQFEKLAANLAPNVTPQIKKQLAGLLPRWIAMSDEAKKKGLEKTPQYEDRLKIAKMQILMQALQQEIQEQAAKISPEEIETYYKEHADTFEQFNVDRLFVPRTKQPDTGAKLEDEKGDKTSEEAQKAKQAEEKEKADQAEQEMSKLAETLRARAAAGEDFTKLQKEAFEATGMKIQSPTVNLPSVRRTGLPQTHAAIFDLKPGEVSQVINDSGGHYIYKVISKTEIPLDQAQKEIQAKLQNDRQREMLEKVNSSFKVETNEAYFGPNAAPGMVGGRMTPGQMGPPPRMQNRPNTASPAPPSASPQPPPAQPPAAPPN